MKSNAGLPVPALADLDPGVGAHDRRLRRAFAADVQLITDWAPDG
jgi:hypothetical protein